MFPNKQVASIDSVITSSICFVGLGQRCPFNCWRSTGWQWRRWVKAVFCLVLRRLWHELVVKSSVSINHKCTVLLLKQSFRGMHVSSFSEVLYKCTFSKNTNFSELVRHLRENPSHSLRPCPHVSGYFWIRNFFFPDTASVYMYPVNQAYESATFLICSSERKFFNILWIRNRVDAISAFFLSCNLTRSSPVHHRE